MIETELWGKKMTVLSCCAKAVVRTGRRLADLARNTRGVAALEFALVTPLLLGMYFVTIEVSQGIETNKKLARVSSTVADLVTQQQSMTVDQLQAIMKVGKAILKPYRRSDVKIVVTAIEITDEQTPAARVAWSQATTGSQQSCVVKAPGATPDLPEKLRIRGSFLINVQACLDYEPMITWAAGQGHETGLGVMGTIFKNGIMEMKETYYLSPRMSPTIPCTGAGC